VEGVVTNPDGKPAAGVEVGPSLWFQNIEDDGTPVRTDRAGHFSFRLTPRTISDEIVIALDKKHSLRGHARLPDASRKETPATPVKISLHATGVITGRVLEGDKPISHAGVQLDELEPVKGSRDGSLIALNRYGATTDADGRFTFPFVEAGRRLNLSVYSQGYAETDQRSGTVEVAVGQTLEVPPFSLIRMDKFVAGIVVDPEGKPVAGVVVGARMRSGQSFPRGFAREPTGSDGRFTIRGVPNVPLTLDAYIRPADSARDRSIRFSSRVEAEPGQADVRIVLDPKLARRKK
jgi:hypothetical protein